MFYLLHFWCSTLHLMKSAKRCLYNSGIKVDILDTCAAMICSYFGIAFLLFFIRIENAVYTFCQNSALLFINGLIFDIMYTRNNQSLESEWKPMLASLRSVNDRRFSWLCKVISRLAEFCSEMPRKLWKKCWPENIYIVGRQTYEGLKISVNSIIETAQFLFWHQVKYVLTERFFQDPFENWFGR